MRDHRILMMALMGLMTTGCGAQQKDGDVLTDPAGGQTAAAEAVKAKTGAGLMFGSGKIQERTVQTMENNLVAVALAPEIGGRVLSFKLRGGGESLYVYRHNINFNPDDQWTGAEYGGLNDMAGSSWPGPFWKLPYTCQATEYKHGGAGWLLTAQAEGIGIEKSVTLEPESTMLRYQVQQKNLKDVPQSMTLRTHGEFAIGTRADNNDVIFFRDKQGLQAVPYRLGWENPRFSYENLAEPWMAYVDTAEKLALVRLFDPIPSETRVFFWRGHNEGGPVRDEKGGFYALDRVLPEAKVEPGKFISASETLYLIKGLGWVDFVNKEVAGGVKLDQQAYGPGQEASLTVTVGGGTAGGPYRVELNSENADFQGKILVAEHPAGGARSAIFKLNPQKSAELVVIVRDDQGQEIGQARARLIVDAEGYQQAEVMLKAAREIAGGIEKSLKEKNLLRSAQGQAQVKLAAVLVAQLENPADKGEFGAVQTQGKSVLSQLAEMQAGVEKLPPADPRVEGRIKELVEEIGR